MVRQLGREIIEKYTWLERANITMGYSANLLFDFADLDELCKDIEGELDSHSLGAGFSSQGQRIDEFVEHRSALLSYTSDVLYDIDEYLENPLYKGFNNAVDLMAAIDMRDAKTDNTIGLQEHTSMYVGAGMYDEVGGDMTSLNLEDFIGSRNKNNSLTNYQKVDDFAELFAKDYEDLVNNDKIDPSKVTLQEYLDSLVLKEFAHKKDAPFWKELLESLSEMTVVIPIIEAATGKTLITGDYLTGDERAFKVVSGAVSLVTLGYGAAIAKGGGMALAKMFAADILAEAVSGSTVIVCDKAGVPSAVTVALAIVLGSTTGVIADKALLKNGIKVTGVDEVDNTIKGGLKSGLTQSQIDDIVNIPKGSRPEPSTYLNQDYIDTHLAQFDDGVSVIQTDWAYSRYSETNGFVGVPDDNTLFVMPKNYCDDVITRANGNISIIEKELGFPNGYFSDGGGLIRIDTDNVSGLNIRIPSGNETGANKLWIPGGNTSGGVPEAITDTIPLKDTTVTRIEVK
ncbi:pre-toxin TG domain-containing protein [Clostridium sp. KNHs205]|uniref:pre-toxin TG domain-containing protein n=1 Tax=Clostridium sp. KNHs205 TaxID=1449050 RepID=UPI000689CECC|nr:pre-toxin TG domain-containing protein [Clostridium sp. KNHs205]